MQFAVGVKPELVWLPTMKCGVARAIRGSDLAQEGALTIQTRVVRRPILVTHHGTINMTQLSQKSLIVNTQFFLFQAQPLG